ncbi:hypothetical protein DSD19_04550 [Rhodovulum sp. BSW8]|uniref:hypothetical protein n=1 Tax=Rhodovulum sp. BSW8 TaxID=2259645 RepID=UPI000DE2026A|nr:hypothetical protein [Rhodovulum sp. BSW8]RBO54651.1 hypothetical protein DSD19_04550 [Rhodovulum sp. BSW8]
MLTIRTSHGEIPVLNNRLLPEGFAAHAENTRFETGTLMPYRRAALAHQFDVATKTVIRHGGQWIGLPFEADVAPAPVAEDRIYFTVDGAAPKMLADGVTYDLALPPPATAPTISTSGTTDPAEIEDIGYAYTFVTSFNEESAPSPPSSPVEWSDGVTVTVEGFAEPAAGRGVDRIRIYRSQTSALGDTSLYFVKELTLPASSWDHDLETDPMQEILPSVDFDMPPDDLAGLTAMPNGMMAGFTGKQLWFCEPYQPHAWPAKYMLTLDYPIVGLASFGSALAIMTKGTPYLAQGTAPETMAMEKMEALLPCVSKDAIVDLGYAAVYPSSDGLVMISPQGARIITGNLFLPREWRRLSPATFFAAQYRGLYVFAYLAEDIPIADAQAPGTDFTDIPLWDCGGPSTTEGVIIYDGGSPFTEAKHRALGIINAGAEQPEFVRVSSDVAVYPASLYFSVEDELIYTLGQDGALYEFDSAYGAPSRYTWTSPEFRLPSVTGYAGVYVEIENAELQPKLTVEVFAGGKLIHTRDDVGDGLFRLPSGFKDRTWQVTLSGNAEVAACHLLESYDEIAGGA